MQGDVQTLGRQRLPGQAMFLAQAIGQLGYPLRRERIRHHREEQAFGWNVTAQTQGHLGLGGGKLLRHGLVSKAGCRTRSVAAATTVLGRGY